MSRSARGGAPRTVGRAGVGLEDTSWAVNDTVARVGRDGELRTEELLAKLADRRSGVTVIHDLTIPIPGFKANIDHAIVSGRRVVLIDTKVWKPGRYWTFGGKTRRGSERVPHVDKANPQFAFDAVSRYLTGRGITFTMATPLIAVWSSSKRLPVKLFWLRIRGGDTFPAAKLLRKIRRAVGDRNADPAIVAALSELVAGRNRRPTATIVAPAFTPATGPRSRSNPFPMADVPAPSPTYPAAPVPQTPVIPTHEDSWFA